MLKHTKVINLRLVTRSAQVINSYGIGDKRRIYFLEREPRYKEEELSGSEGTKLVQIHLKNRCRFGAEQRQSEAETNREKRSSK